MMMLEERMASARAAIIARRRAPRVFYLNEQDYAAFAATNPPTVEESFALPLGHKPSPMTCLAFDGIAVRQSTAKPGKSGYVASRLISRCGISANLPQ